jgi:hypothetical protein
MSPCRLECSQIRTQVLAFGKVQESLVDLRIGLPTFLVGSEIWCVIRFVIMHDQKCGWWNFVSHPKRFWFQRHWSCSQIFYFTYGPMLVVREEWEKALGCTCMKVCPSVLGPGKLTLRWVKNTHGSKCIAELGWAMIGTWASELITLLVLKTYIFGPSLGSEEVKDHAYSESLPYLCPASIR